MNIEVKMTINVPVEATDDEIQEWLDFHLIGGRLNLGNPLSDHDAEARTFSIDFKRT